MDPQNTNQGQSHIIFYCIAGLIAVLIFPPLVGLSVYYKNKKQKEKKKTNPFGFCTVLLVIGGMETMMIGDNSISVYFDMLFLHGLDIVCILQSLPIFYVILQYEAEYAFSCCVPPERGVTLSSLLLLFLQNKLINRFNFAFPSHVHNCCV